MHEISLLTSIVALIITAFFTKQYYKNRVRIDLILSLYGMIFTTRQIVLYIWLNLEPLTTARIILRATDYLIGIPLMLLGFELFYSSAASRVRGIDRRVKPITNLGAVIILSIIAMLYLLIDVESARRLAVLVVFPFLFGVLIYYLIIFINNPYKIPKPEYERGINLILLGYLTQIFGTAFFAGILRQVDLGIATELVSVLIVGAGGIVSETVTFAGLYEKLDAGLIVIDNNGHIEMVKLYDKVEQYNRSSHASLTAEAIILYINDYLEQVFESGREVTIPHLTLDPLEHDKIYRIDIIPHRLDRESKPLSILIIITDVTSSIREMESEKLADLFKKYLEERDTARLYFDLLSHDIGNLLQVILFAADSGEFDNDPQFRSDIMHELLAKVNRSRYLLKEVRIMARAKEYAKTIKPIDVGDAIREAIISVQEFLSEGASNIDIDVTLNEGTRMALADDLITHGLMGVLRFFITNHSGSNGLRIDISSPDEGHVVLITFTDPTIEISESLRPHIFSQEARVILPIDSIGLILAKKVFNRYGGTIKLKGSEQGTTIVVQLPAA